MSDDIFQNKGLAGIVNLSISDNSSGGAVLERAAKLLAGFPGGIEKASLSAVRRAASSGQTGAAREVNKLYYIKTGDFKKYTTSKQSVRKSGNEISVGVTFGGYHIPLIRFNTRLTSSGRISTQVRRDSAAKVFQRAFRAETESGHINIFERVGRSRLPISDFYGPSVPQMMGANPELSKAVAEKMSQTFEERMEHEITAIMNGWRV